MKQSPLSAQFYQKNGASCSLQYCKVRELCFGKQGFPLALSVHALWASGKSKGAASGTVMRSC